MGSEWLLGAGSWETEEGESHVKSKKSKGKKIKFFYPDPKGSEFDFFRKFDLKTVIVGKGEVFNSPERAASSGIV